MCVCGGAVSRLLDAEAAAFRRAFQGPGKWISTDLLGALEGQLGASFGVPDIGATSIAAGPAIPGALQERTQPNVSRSSSFNTCVCRPCHCHLQSCNACFDFSDFCLQ